MAKTVQYRKAAATALPDSKRPPRKKERYVPEPRIFEGCCSPYPDVNYAERSGHDHTPAVYRHHTGSSCAGYLEPVPFDEWYYGKRRVV